MASHQASHAVHRPLGIDTSRDDLLPHHQSAEVKQWSAGLRRTASPSGVSNDTKQSIMDMLAEQLIAVTDALERTVVMNQVIMESLNDEGRGVLSGPSSVPSSSPRVREERQPGQRDGDGRTPAPGRDIWASASDSPRMLLVAEGRTGTSLPGLADSQPRPRVDFDGPRAGILEDLNPELTEPLLRQSSEESAMEALGADTANGDDAFPTADEIRRRVEDSLPEEYNVENLYYTTGFFQALIKDDRFTILTFAVIIINTGWMGFDTDWNHADILCNALMVFQVADNIFCAYFFFELSVRFLAFRRKCDAFRDGWFLFDLFLVSLMIWETWIIVALYTMSGGTIGGGGQMRSSSILRIFRVFRLTRAGRLLQAVPELAVLVKGMVMAIRTVTAVLILLLITMYVFSILFTQLLGGTDVAEGTFDSVPQAMNYLLLQVLCGFDADFINKLLKAGTFYYLMYLLYMIVASVTLMNMLIGVICEVLAQVGQDEKQDKFEKMVDHQIGTILRKLDADGSQSISKEEFPALIENPDMLRNLFEIGVDIIAFTDNVLFNFHGCEEVSIVEFLDMMKQFRGSTPVTVKDMMDMRKFVQMEVQNLEARLRKPVRRESDEEDIEQKVVRSQANTGGGAKAHRTRHK